MLRFAAAKGWISEHWEEIPIVALAAACFAAAQAIGGSGFIACFVGGLLLSGLRPAHKEELLRGAVGTGEALALLTWVAFGVGALAQIIPRLSWLALLYAALSLTVIRMVPVVLCLAGTGMRVADKLFIAWFGPRGLATIVFGVIVFNEKLPGNDTIIAVAGGTVLLSVIAHGISANPLVKAVVARSAERLPSVKSA
jgi:NhaP-type Na+/H+ or K+/H+ antiporter